MVSPHGDNTYVAGKDIKKGEEFTCSYKWEDIEKKDLLDYSDWIKDNWWTLDVWTKYGNDFDKQIYKIYFRYQKTNKIKKQTLNSKYFV